VPANPYEALVPHAASTRPCLHLDDGTTWTYADLDARSAALAGALGRAGARAGDRVLAQVAKSPDAVALYLACLRAGVVFVPLNTAYTAAEVQGFVDDAEPALVVDDDRLAALVADDGPPRHDLEPRADGDPAAMLYTSGTTGRAKGAVLSVANLVSNARALVDAWRFEADDVVVHVLPIFHVHGLFVALHCALGVGAATRLHERFDPDTVVADLPRSTVLMGVPTHHHRLLAHPDLTREACSALRLVTSGSAPLTADDHVAFAERTGHEIVERYGMTETLILTSNPYDGARVPGTVGFPLAGVELRVVDGDGEPVPTGEAGDVEVRGPGVSQGYWRRPDADAEAFRADGWFRTGDVGTLDGEGRLTLVGRAKDLIIAGGYNVYPKEVELAIDRAPGVEESAVVGVPDADLGEVVAAVVVRRPGSALDEADVLAACADLARFKRPRRVVFVDELPRNAMGKVEKALLRRQLG